MSILSRLFGRRPAEPQASWNSARNTRQSRYKRAPASPPQGGPIRDVDTLRRMSRHLVRNDALGRRAVDVITGGIVGHGITPRILGSNGMETGDLGFIIRDYLETPLVDAYGRSDIYGLQRLVQREVVEGGEAIIRRRSRRALDRLPIPVQFEVLPGEYIDDTVDGILPNGNMAVSGIEFDRFGRRVAYYMHTAHPHETTSLMIRGLRTGNTVRVAASEVIHVFRNDRAGQPRGVPWLAPVIGRMQEYAEFSDAVILRQKVAALFSVFIVSDNDASDVLDLEQAETDADDLLVTIPEAGLGQRLNPGEDVRFPSLPNTDGAEGILQHFKRDIAAALGISYEVFAGDYSQGNFSNSRMGWLEHSRSIATYQDDLMLGQFLTPLSAWIMEAASLVAPRTDGVRIKWTPPRREMIDPVRETNALTRALDAGITSRRAIAEGMGLDVVEIDNERAEDMRREITLGLRNPEERNTDDV